MLFRSQVESGKGSYWRDRTLSNSLPLSESGNITVALDVPTIQIPQLAAEAPGVVVLSPDDVKNQVRHLIEVAFNG